MVKPWIAILADVRQHKKLTDLPSDTARWGWLVMLGEAKLLRQDGTFTVSQWRETMGRFARYREDYIAAGLLHKAPHLCDADHQARCIRGRGPFPSGMLVVHDWPVHQREHAVRQADYRERQSDARSDGESDDESDADSRALSLSLSNVAPQPTSEVRPKPRANGLPPADPAETYYLLTVKPPKKSVLDWLERLSDEHGGELVSKVMGSVWSEKADPSTFLSDVEAALVLGARRAERESEDARRRADQEAERREQERIAAMTPEQRAAAKARFDAEVAPMLGRVVKGMPS